MNHRRLSPSQKLGHRQSAAGRSERSRDLLLLCGGGTGGHVYPALAVASALDAASSLPRLAASLAGGDLPLEPAAAGVAKPREELAQSVARAVGAEGEAEHPGADERHEQYRLIYIGSVGGMEQEIVERESSLPFRAIRAAAVRGRGPITLARNAGILQLGTLQARRLLRSERPAAILGTGGYVCVPLFVAARMERVPTMIYLPDIVPGLAVRVLARLATRVACSFEPSLQYLPRAKTIVTGYPVRPELGQLDRDESRKLLGLTDTRPVLLVYGGSRGSRSINRAVEQLLPALLELSEIVHVCGREGDEGFLREAAERLPAEQRGRYHLHPYLQGTMPHALTAADLTICRSGASTLAELPAVGLPAVLVPYPFVHQDINAAYLAERGAAVTVADGEMLGSGAPEQGPLFQAVRRLLTDDQARGEMAERSRALARPDAAQRLAEALIELAA